MSGKAPRPEQIVSTLEAAGFTPEIRYGGGESPAVLEIVATRSRDRARVWIDFSVTGTVVAATVSRRSRGRQFRTGPGKAQSVLSWVEQHTPTA